MIDVNWVAKEKIAMAQMHLLGKENQGNYWMLLKNSLEVDESSIINSRQYCELQVQIIISLAYPIQIPFLSPVAKLFRKQ